MDNKAGHTPSGTVRLPWVDALRGLAVLGVIAVHSSDRVSYGARGVQLFFFVSAFTLMTSMAGRSEPVRYFFIRRFFRIAPMFYVATLFYAVWEGRSDLAGIAATLSLLFGLTPWTLASVVVPGGWSIGAEVLFYVVLPYFSPRSNPLRALSAIMLLALLGDMAVTKWGPTLMPDSSSDAWRGAAWVWFMVLSWSTAFPAGMLFFHIWSAVRGKVAASVYGRAELDVVLVIVLLYLTRRLTHYGDDVVPIVLTFIPLGFCLALGAGRWIVTRPMRWLGKISFSCYLSHFAFLDFAHAVAERISAAYPATGTFVFTLALTVACSSFTYLWIERPFIRAGEALIRQMAGKAKVVPTHNT